MIGGSTWRPFSSACGPSGINFRRPSVRRPMTRRSPCRARRSPVSDAGPQGPIGTNGAIAFVKSQVIEFSKPGADGAEVKK